MHIAFTDAFLSAQQAVGHDLRPRFGRSWPDAYVGAWARSAEALGATDLPGTQAELAEALASYRGVLEPVPDELRAFLKAPPGLGAAEQLFYRGLTGGAAYLLSPTLAPLAQVPGRGSGGRARVALTRAQLRGLQLVLGPYSPSEEAARWRLGTGPRPTYLLA